jgi:hypothetical protein
MDTGSYTCGGETRGGGGGSDMDASSDTCGGEARGLVNATTDSCGGESRGGGGGPCGGVEDLNGFVDELEVVGS